ncbi:MAG: hypothetical protein KME15_08510 [Drouetiella hepatica Uher 2000/2452]|jgi:hypothetical protein|uniref:FHA domain containing protein n=1 Tax=Drouetiella hepatica Uher 2000/2452 TaxID=904376 RepID=A0A951UM13_9CYAN|nr:hypothetical protein [Drouetiella hepatica Uher 2000/2452]
MKNNGIGVTRRLLATLLAVVLGFGLGSCSAAPGIARSSGSAAKPPRMVKLAEVPPPAAIRELRRDLDKYQPQVEILSPRSDEVLQNTEVSVRFQTKDIPLFLNEEFGLGSHLHVILDNQPYVALYDADEPMILKDLEPGTHTIRAFASRPWHESFKNEGAYAQTTFHVFTKTPENNPTLQPLLTYSRPKGSYGAEPIMLDFYLANAPLHLVANQDAEDDILDWQVRCTINGESFIVDRWEPIYLKGLKPGKTWVQLELLDEKGNPYPNTFNNTVRLIDYQPGGTDTLSKLIRGDLSAAEVRAIVDRDYVYQPEPIAPEPIDPEPHDLPPLEAPPEIPSAEPTLEPLPETPAIPAPALLPPEVLPPIVKSPTIIEPPPELEAPSPEVPLQTEEEVNEKIDQSIKQQLPDAVEEFLEDQDLELPPVQDPAPNLLGKPLLNPVPANPAPAVDKPLLRQWRDRLKQVVPLPEPSSETQPFLKQWGDRAKEFLGGAEASDFIQEPVAPIEPALPKAMPQIMDVPPDEKLEIQIAKPEAVPPVEPSPTAKAPQLFPPEIQEAIEPPAIEPQPDVEPVKVLNL